MKVIGITGGVGCGKSTVLDILKNDYDAQIIEADKVGHIVMEKGNIAYDKIVSLFGVNILNSDLSINRKELANIVFNNEELLLKINAIIHPAVKQYIKQFIVEMKEINAKLVVVEAALLIEAGYRDICDVFWYVYASKQTRIKRLQANRGYSLEKIHSIMLNQLNDDKFRKNTDYMINNDNTINDLRLSISEAVKTLNN